MNVFLYLSKNVVESFFDPISVPSLPVEILIFQMSLAMILLLFNV